MKILKCEVEGDEIINFPVAGFDFAKTEDDGSFKKMNHDNNVIKHLPTTATLLTTYSKQILIKNCVFCNRRHPSSECFQHGR